MTMWIFDEKWWPSGSVGGKVPEKYAAKRLVAAGYGEFQPVGDNNSEQGREQNRRIEIVVLPPDA